MSRYVLPEGSDPAFYDERQQAIEQGFSLTKVSIRRICLPGSVENGVNAILGTVLLIDYG